MKKPFRHFRFSLKGLFAATLFVACVAATLRYATRLWTDAAFTLALAAVAVAILGTIYRSGATRAFWAGALLGGGGYLLLAYGPWIGEYTRPHLVTTPLFSAAYEKMQATFNYPPGAPSSAPTIYDSPSPYPNVPSLGDAYASMPVPEMPDAAAAPQSGATTEAAGDSSYFIPNAVQPDSANAALYDPTVAPPASPPFAVYPPPTTWVSDVPQWDDLERAGHSLTALLAALAFGNIAQWFYRTRRVAVAP